MFTPTQISLIRSSFSALADRGEQTTSDIYVRMFELDPNLRFLFPHDIDDTQRKLTSMIGFIVLRLHRWDLVEPRLRNLGRRHKIYGVRPADYGTFGQAVIDILATHLDPVEGAETLRAWTELVQRVAQTMIEAQMDEAS